MTIEEKIRQIMHSEELSSAEKLDSLYSLIRPDSCKIDKLSQATPAHLKKLRDGIAVTQAMQELRAKLPRKKESENNAAKPLKDY